MAYFPICQVCGIPISEHSVDCADNEPYSATFCRNNHGHLIGHFFESMLEMESDDGGLCYFHEGRCCKASLSDYDFAVVCFPCQPWSSLGNRKNRAAPNQHKYWSAVFGAEGSAISLVRRKHPRIVLFENVDGFRTLLDDSGRTGLQRLEDEMYGIKGGGSRFYRGSASVRITTDCWGAPGRSRLLDIIIMIDMNYNAKRFSISLRVDFIKRLKHSD